MDLEKCNGHQHIDQNCCRPLWIHPDQMLGKDHSLPLKMINYIKEIGKFLLFNL